MFRIPSEKPSQSKGRDHMSGKTIRAGLIVVLMLFGCVAGARAQAVVAPEKRELIKELLELTGGTKAIDAMMEAIDRQQERDLPELISQSVPGKNLTPAERAALEQKMRDTAIRVHKRMKAVFERMNYQQMVLDIGASIFSKYFDEGELKGMIAFYKSPLGKKTIELMPAMMTEMMAQMSKTILPKIQVEMDKIIADETKQFEQESKSVSRPPTPHKTSKRRRRP